MDKYNKVQFLLSCICSRDPYFMPNIISSAIVNAPPPAVVVRTLHTYNYASELWVGGWG